MEALLAICEGRVDHRELGDAATKVVAVAENLGLPDPIRRLERAMSAASDKPYNQIKLARALLRTSDADLRPDGADRTHPSCSCSSPHFVGAVDLVVVVLDVTRKYGYVVY